MFSNEYGHYDDDDQEEDDDEEEGEFLAQSSA